MSGSRRFRSLQRKVQPKSPKRKFIIYSEGEKTERDYFEAMRRHFQSAVVEIEIIAGAGVPLTIAKAATSAAQVARKRDRKNSYANRDEFWAVFDRDEHPNVQDAIDRCHQANVGVAFSDPCFELWLILHFQDFDRPDHRHDVQRHLETLCTDYDRARRKTTSCQKLMPLVVDAELRAERQVARREAEGNQLSAPYTKVYELARRIRTRG